MKKKVVTSGNKPIDKKVRYAVFNRNDRLISKGMYTASEIQQYLNQKAQEGKNYYAIELQGLSRKLTAKELKPLENKLKNGEDSFPTKDLTDLKSLLKILKTKAAWEGMIKAYHFDTALREEIPLSIWKKMGGDTL
ncbi:hypothetical protein GCM10009122_33070 [Fulvivirga kasyanovii]|jgi:hypothetical protein|uniref:Uncharacterized protein n=2 Tax=Cytophagales TaxID=768507 RepID=A0AA49JDJ7_9BACT|nr:hypothetical protein [Fulvivirga kasyanovii]MBT28476.1 hypothetical protein [Thalassovita sp.]MTI27809.1 hypothetical protein [Fulvivirga kasyanovii]WKN35996.1 hypothetical protein K4G66_26885 [Tunicatimonas sp. TK19036]